MKYDDASWHHGGDFPMELPPSAGATHIGMFLAWMLLNGQAGALHLQEPVSLAHLGQRTMTPGQWVLCHCDGKFTDADLSDEGNRFAEVYYAYDEDRYEEGEPTWLSDYAKSFPDAENAYSVPDDWASYDRLAPLLAQRFALWRGMELGRGST
jgi:hypothetical protein